MHQDVAIVQKSKTVCNRRIGHSLLMCLMVDLSTQVLYW